MESVDVLEMQKWVICENDPLYSKPNLNFYNEKFQSTCEFPLKNRLGYIWAHHKSVLNIPWTVKMPQHTLRCRVTIGQKKQPAKRFLMKLSSKE